jgi:hypothetical protein
MGQKETLIAVVLEKQAEKDKAIEVYNKARELLQFYMQDNDLDMIDDGTHQFILETRHKVDYDLLKEKYPEIYMKGMTYRFDEIKAKEYFPKDVLKQALGNCAERMTTFVKIQRNLSKRKRNKT